MDELTILRKACAKAHVDYKPESAFMYANREMTKTEEVLTGKEYYQIIFSHEFAQKFFGFDLLCYDCGEKVKPPMTVMNGAVQIGTGQCDCSRQFENNEPAWEYHLQMMVTQPKPLKYLERFIEEDL